MGVAVHCFPRETSRESAKRARSVTIPGVLARIDVHPPRAGATHASPRVIVQYGVHRTRTSAVPGARIRTVTVSGPSRTTSAPRATSRRPCTSYTRQSRARQTGRSHGGRDAITRASARADGSSGTSGTATNRTPCCSSQRR